jgi:branched-chain amino acid transport system permease protein
VFYALMAIGLSLIFGILKIVNFAHGGLHRRRLCLSLVALALGVPPWLALPFAFLVG